MAVNKCEPQEWLRRRHAVDATLEYRRIMMLAGSLLTLVAISCASLGLWRMGVDLDWAGGFVFETGFLSHWQVWVGVAVGVQYTSFRLTRSVETPVPVRSELRSGGETHKPADAV